MSERIRILHDAFTKLNLEFVLRFVEVFAVAIAAIWAIASFNEAQEARRIEKAYDTWQGYFEFAAEHPEMAIGQEKYPSGDKIKDEKYMWFVERMLIASELIMQADPKSIQWQDTIMYEVKPHKSYIMSDDFLLPDGRLMSSYCTYERSVRDLIRSAFVEERGRERLKVAEADCRARLRKAGEPDA